MLQKQHGRGFLQQEGSDVTLKYLNEGETAEETETQFLPLPSDCPRQQGIILL